MSLRPKIIMSLPSASDRQLEEIAAILGIETDQQAQIRKDHEDATAAYCWSDSAPTLRNDNLVDVVYTGSREDIDEDEQIRQDHAIATNAYTWKGA